MEQSVLGGWTLLVMGGAILVVAFAIIRIWFAEKARFLRKLEEEAHSQRNPKND